MKRQGHWQKEVPSRSGKYWTACRNGDSAGIQNVHYDAAGGLVFAGDAMTWLSKGAVVTWGGWWWSEPVEEPPVPGPWETPQEILEKISRAIPKKKKRATGPAKAPRKSRGDEWLDGWAKAIRKTP